MEILLLVLNSVGEKTWEKLVTGKLRSVELWKVSFVQMMCACTCIPLSVAVT